VTRIGGKSEEEVGRLAGQVLISALAVPVTEALDELKGENVRRPFGTHADAHPVGFAKRCGECPLFSVASC
jgi:hypothetical protein